MNNSPKLYPIFGENCTDRSARIENCTDRPNCLHCGSSALQIHPGNPPHWRSLRCQDYGRFIKWLSKAQHSELGNRLPELSQSELLGLGGAE